MKIAINVATGAVANLDDILWVDTDDIKKKSMSNSEVIAFAKEHGRRVIPVAHPYREAKVIPLDTV